MNIYTFFKNVLVTDNYIFNHFKFVLYISQKNELLILGKM